MILARSQDSFTLTNTLTPVNEFGVRGSSHISETVMKLAPYRGAHLTGGGGWTSDKLWVEWLSTLHAWKCMKVLSWIHIYAHSQIFSWKNMLRGQPWFFVKKISKLLSKREVYIKGVYKGKNVLDCFWASTTLYPLRGLAGPLVCVNGICR